jgi:hypothetical protein
MSEGNRIELDQVREDPNGAVKNMEDELKTLDLFADGAKLKGVYVCSAKAAFVLDLFCRAHGLNCPEPVKGYDVPQEAESLQGLVEEHHLLRIEDSQKMVKLGIIGERFKYVLDRMFTDAGRYLRHLDLLPHVEAETP